MRVFEVAIDDTYGQLQAVTQGTSHGHMTWMCIPLSEDEWPWFRMPLCMYIQYIYIYIYTVYITYMTKQNK